MTDNEIIKAFDILCKIDFFGGQRAGRELWNEKPTDIQNKDIENFSNDVAFLKDFINRLQAENEKLAKDWSDVTIEKDELFDLAEKQKAEIERLQKENTALMNNNNTKAANIEYLSKIVMATDKMIIAAKAETIKDFAERLKCGVSITSGIITCENVDNLVKKMVGEDKVQWSKQGECPITPEQFNAIYDDKEMVGDV